MRQWSKTSRDAIVPAVLVFISLLMITLSHRYETAASRASGWMGDMLAPVEKAAHSVSYHVADWFRALFTLGRLSEENRRLREELAQLRGAGARTGDLEREVAELRRLLKFREEFAVGGGTPQALGAEVIARDPTSWYSSVVIDRGTSDGIKTDDPVITQEGLVGRVRRTGSHSSQVMLILDEQSGVGVLDERSRAVGVVKGRGRDICEMVYLSPRADVKPGDFVVTSGLGAIYPKGLRIGRIVAVRVSSYMQTADVEPYVDFSRLEKVLVLRWGRGRDRVEGRP